MAEVLTPIDWERVMIDIRRAGFGDQQLADRTGIARTTLHGYRALGAEPGYTNGTVLLRLWCECRNRPQSAAPRKRLLVAAK